jgi:hypothetical protein
MDNAAKIVFFDSAKKNLVVRSGTGNDRFREKSLVPG